jgi:hypothetical protein
MKTVQVNKSVNDLQFHTMQNEYVAEALLWLTLAIREPENADHYLSEVERIADTLSGGEVKIVDLG